MDISNIITLNTDAHALSEEGSTYPQGKDDVASGSTRAKLAEGGKPAVSGMEVVTPYEKLCGRSAPKAGRARAPVETQSHGTVDREHATARAGGAHDLAQRTKNPSNANADQDKQKMIP